MGRAGLVCDLPSGPISTAIVVPATDFVNFLSTFQGTHDYSRIVDLSWPVSPDIPCWPGDPPVEFETVADIATDGYNLRRFSMGEHSGTHLTAPASYFADGVTADEYPPERLVVPAVVLDVRGRCQANPDYAAALEDIAEWEAVHGPVPEGRLVLLWTGWQAHWYDPGRYLGRDPDGVLHFPGFGVAAARFLLEERRIAGIGTDTAGVEPGVDQTFSVSKLVLAQPRILLENLTNLDRLPPTGTLLVIGLLRLVHGAGAPVAVTALIP